MPKVQVYLKHGVIDEIKGLVAEDVEAGANPAEVSFSSKAAMLLELGLRVHNLRRSERVGSGHDDYDRVLMSAALEAKYLTQFLAKTLAEMNNSDITATKERVKANVQEDMEPFFQEVDDE